MTDPILSGETWAAIRAKINAIGDAADISSLSTVGFPTRAAFVTANAANPGLGLADGQTVLAGGQSYRRQSGATMLPGLAGFVPPGFGNYYHFGAVGDGVANDTAAIQAAASSGLWLMPTAGRFLVTGTISVANGTYLFAAAVPNFASMSVTSAADLSGVVIVSNFAFAAGTAEVVFDLERGARLENHLFYSTLQPPTRPANWTPVDTPWAIAAGSFTEGSFPNRDERTYICDNVILEHTRGIRLRRAERAVVERNRGNCFTRFIEADGCFDVMRLTDNHHWPFGGNTGASQENERRWTLNNCVAFRFGRVDGLMGRGNFSIYAGTSLEFYPSEGPVGFVGHATTNFSWTDCYLDGTNISLRVTGTYAAGWQVDGSIVGGHLFRASNLDAEILAPSENIVIESPIRQITIMNADVGLGGFTGTKGFVRHTGGAGLLRLIGCDFPNWDSGNVGEPAFFASAGSIVHVDGFVPLDNLAAPVSLTGKTLTGGTGQVRLSSVGGNASFPNGLTVDGPITGTAVTQSAADPTAGRLLKVADFGLGGLVPTLDANALGLRTAFHRLLTNSPFGARASQGLIVAAQVDGLSVQAAIREAANATEASILAVRSRTAAGDWTAWNQLFGRANLLGAVSQTGGVPTGAVIERGSNANGEFVRFADGTQICTSPVFVADATTARGSAFQWSADQTWTYPVGFVAAPLVTPANTNNTQVVGAVASPGLTSCNVNVVSLTSLTNRSMRAVAIGRWF